MAKSQVSINEIEIQAGLVLFETNLPAHMDEVMDSANIQNTENEK